MSDNPQAPNRGRIGAAFVCYICKAAFRFLRGDWRCPRCGRAVGSGWGGVA